jgi:hypothetical protein
MSSSRVYGLVAEFDSAGQLVEATRAARENGYRRLEAYSPYPIEDLDEIIGGHNPVPLITLLGGMTGALTAWTMQYYIAAIDYPTNIGGRPLYSWPAFIVITFELTVLFASLSAFLGTLALCGFPRPNFPLFNLPRFAAASRDTFFLCIEARDLMFAADKAAKFLETLDPVEVWEVEDS